MSWFSSAPTIDKHSERWGTSVHEASHVVTAFALGGYAVAWLERDDYGQYDGSLPDSCTDVDEAVVLLAGGVGAKWLTGDPHDACSDDVARARKLLRGTGVSERRARSDAERIVRSSKAAILTAAETCYLTGRI